MKQYPKIDFYNMGLYGQNVFAFDKIDGSNIRVEYSRKRGWYKFGTKSVMIDKNSEHFSDVIDIFLNKYGESLGKIFTDNKKYRSVQNFVVFGEYYGENTFAGQHVDEDKKDIILFDVNQYKKGFLPPKQFIEDFGHLDIPKIIYHGEYNDNLIKSIQNNKYNLKEGVICKGTYKTKNNKEEVWMTKIKTKEWLLKVKELFGNKALIEELNKDSYLINDLNKSC